MEIKDRSIELIAESLARVGVKPENNKLRKQSSQGSKYIKTPKKVLRAPKQEKADFKKF